MINGIAGILAKEFLENAKRQYLEDLRKALLKSELLKQRTELMKDVAKKYSEEVKENISSYIKSVGEASVEVEYSGRPGQAFVNRASMAVAGVEKFLREQEEEGPIIQFLKQRYHEEGINIITGNLYGGHLVSSTSMDSVEILNKMGYASAVDTRKPWLSSPETASGIEEILKEAVVDLFDQAFTNIDLSEDVALLKMPIRAKTKKKPAAKATGSAQKGTIYITNGKENRRVLPTEKIPKGWKKGRVKNW